MPIKLIDRKNVLNYTKYFIQQMSTLKVTAASKINESEKVKTTLTKSLNEKLHK